MKPYEQASTITSDGIPPEVQLAIGRLFRLGSRPTQAGDVEVYEQCKALILAASEGKEEHRRA